VLPSPCQGDRAIIEASTTDPRPASWLAQPPWIGLLAWLVIMAWRPVAHTLAVLLHHNLYG
jgi:hypothetical protein